MVGYIVGSTDTNTEQLELLNVNVTINMTGGYEEPERYCFFCGAPLIRRKLSLYECGDCGAMFLVEGEYIRVIL